MRYLALAMILLLGSCQSNDSLLSGKEIIDKSIQKHDPNGQWQKANFALRIQEPRLQNPTRYSVIMLNNANGSFSLERNRDKSISIHRIDSAGNATTLFDGNIVTDSILIKKYRLDPSRNFGYRRFYQSLMGLPMSLATEKLDSIGSVSETVFNGVDSYKVAIELEEPLFSKHWKLFFSKSDFSLVGLEMVFPDDPSKGERLYFEGSIDINGFSIPRHKHWHDLSDTYHGSDVIVKTLK